MHINLKVSHEVKNQRVLAERTCKKWAMDKTLLSKWELELCDPQRVKYHASCMTPASVKQV